MATYTSKTDMVAATLRELILSGTMRPGTPLRQRALGEQLGVSQTPVREALQRLESEGLVCGDLHKGMVIAEADAGATEENYQIRAALEALGAELAARAISESDLDRLAEINDEITGLTEDDPRYIELNRQFHFGIYEAAHSPLLLAMMRLLWQAMPRGPRVLRPHKVSAKQHTALLDALRAGDGRRAAAITREHILEAHHLDNQQTDKER